MGYLPQFKNDFFVSYRRASNETQDPWVDSFCKALGASLKELVGEVSIWRDEDQLRTGQRWRPEVAQALNDAAIFLAIVSRTYFDSDECRRELDQFLGRLKDCPGGSSEGQRTIVPIFKQPLKSEQDLPAELGEIQRHNFFDWDPPGSKHFRELGPDRGEEDKRAFWEALARVAQDLMLTLEDLSGRARKGAIGKVFLARVSPELQLERERLRSDLQLRRYLTVPEREYLWNADDHRDRIARDLEDAQICIHLASRTPSIEPETAARSRLQLELAHRVMKEKGRRPPVVWIQPAAAIDGSARDLIKYIQEVLANDGVDYLEGGLEDFKTHVYGMLPVRDPPRVPAPPTREIALLVEEGDVGDLHPINTLLVDQFGLNPNRIKFAGSKPKDALRLSRALITSQQCVIVWARQPEEWVNDLLDNQALAGRQGKNRICVYATAPDTPEKASFRTTKARTILAANGLNEGELRAFFGDEPSVS